MRKRTSWLLFTPAGIRIDGRLKAETLRAPHLLDVEVAQVMRGVVRQRIVSDAAAARALENLRESGIARYEHTLFLDRIWALRANLSAYDAVYIAVAEMLEAPLLTTDAKLARSPGHRAKIELIYHAPLPPTSMRAVSRFIIAC